VEVESVGSCDAGGGGIGGSSSNPKTMVTVRNADGSVCYTREYTCMCNHACEDNWQTWRNAQGEVVADGQANTTRSIVCRDGSGSGSVTCFTPGAPAGCPTWGELPGGPYHATTTSCTEGACALP
jgi:hypothetical protein